MNYLAHIYLSFDQEELLVGNFITDSLRGTHIGQYTEGIRKGVMLHRRIDVFTDTHPVFLKSKHRFSSAFDKFSGILTDIYYDHFLAKHFSRYSALPLKDYSLQQYTILKRYYGIFPPDAQRFFNYMVSRDILFEYSRLPGIELVLRQLSSRLKHPCNLHDSVPVMLQHEPEMEQEFFLFFDELVTYSRAQLELLG